MDAVYNMGYRPIVYIYIYIYICICSILKAHTNVGIIDIKTYHSMYKDSEPRPLMSLKWSIF